MKSRENKIIDISEFYYCLQDRDLGVRESCFHSSVEGGRAGVTVRWAEVGPHPRPVPALCPSPHISSLTVDMLSLRTHTRWVLDTFLLDF